MKKVELVFIPAPGMGHLFSALEFVKCIINRNDHISVTVLALGSPFTKSLDSYAKSVAASQPRLQIVEVPAADPPPQELLKSPAKYFAMFLENHIPRVKKIITDLVSTCSNEDSAQVSGVVMDFFCMSMIGVAKELDIPSFLYMASNVGFLSFVLYLADQHVENTSEFKNPNPELVIPGFINPVPQLALPSSLTNGSYTTYIKLAKKIRETEGILVNSFSELEKYALKSLSDGQTPPVYTVGPFINLNLKSNLMSGNTERDNIITFLDRQPDSLVVFLCFGSMGKFSVNQVKEIAIGLELSGKRFLWSLRLASDEIAIEDALPDGFLERTKGTGMVCGWAPQVEVLAHRAVGGFVSHCGWNSILESLWFGVPIVTWPLYAEQQLNAFKMVRELGLAVELRLDYRQNGGDLVIANEIEVAVRQVMEENSEVRKKVKEMREMARKAMLNEGSSFFATGQFIEDILKN